MLELLASIQDICTILMTFCGIMALSSMAVDDAIRISDGFFSCYSEDEEVERRTE